MNLHNKTNILMEALPYIKKHNHKIAVIKFGGDVVSSMETIIDDVAMVKHLGMKPVIVHGGGPSINKALKKANIKYKFVDGLRYTDNKTMKVVKSVFEKINKDIVSKLKYHGIKAVNAKSLIKVKQKNPVLGLVGQITSINSKKILELIKKDFVPVISPLGNKGNKTHNINADTVASHISTAIKAEKLTIVTNVDGIKIKGKLQSHVDFKTAKKEIKAGIIKEGMVPKVEACMYAVSHKCPKAHLINGLIPHSLLLEFFTDKGIGTEVVFKNGN